MSLPTVFSAIVGIGPIGARETLSGEMRIDGASSRLFEAAHATLSFEIFLGALAVVGALLVSGSVTRRLGLERGRLSAAQTSILVIGTLGMSAALDSLLDISGLRGRSSLAEFDLLVSGIRGRELFVAAVAFALAPGICEELLCRGLLQRGLVPRLGAPLGIALASLTFGVLHLDPIHAAFAGVLGLYLGGVCHLANGIRAAIACHVANNGVALLSAAVFPDLWAEGSWGVLLFGGAVAGAAMARVRTQLESASRDRAETAASSRS